ncbi:MAG TPA: ribbon-helix-helix protein, CopG family [Aquificaceae bacterium]|nr:ribbon-helix-helix protein, CopG family [Aquificaceae bacterium]
MIKGKAFTIYLDLDILKELQREAQARKVSASQIVKEALRRYFREERRKQAARELLEWVKSRKVTPEEREEVLRAWKEYERTERKQERTFSEVFGA